MVAVAGTTEHRYRHIQKKSHKRPTQQCIFFVAETKATSDPWLKLIANLAREVGLKEDGAEPVQVGANRNQRRSKVSSKESTPRASECRNSLAPTRTSLAPSSSAPTSGARFAISFAQGLGARCGTSSGKGTDFAKKYNNSPVESHLKSYKPVGSCQ